MPKKQTMAEKRAKRHADRIEGRLTNRPLPYITPELLGACRTWGQNFIIADTDGNLFRIDAEAGTLRRLRWER